MRKFKIAVIGCGRISVNHFKAIAENEFFELCAVCDTDSVAANNSAVTNNVPAFHTLQELLTVAKPDIVSLCTPSGIHPAQTILSAKHGVHVLTEKPMATRYQDAVDANRVCDEAGTKLFVVKQNRLNKTIDLLKRSIEKGRFGRIYNITSNVFWTRPQYYYDQSSWRGTWDMDGGALMNQASHYADLLTYLGGPLDSVFAYSATLARKIEAEDSITVALRWRNGAIGSLNVSMLTYPSNLEGSITILGEKGTVKIGGVALNRIESWNFETEDTEIDNQIKEASYETNSVYGFGHSGYYQELALALNGLPSKAVSGRSGLQSLQTLIGSYRSVVTNKPISFPLDI
ncbi:MAG: Gfo/Idh/MocA family oxidoreductase [Proteobacteria bacterium]|nr:MAG: Gfo/Idh/MocA family oxidoreductase [Pseudomonadota bacterium]